MTRLRRLVLRLLCLAGLAGPPAHAEDPAPAAAAPAARPLAQEEFVAEVGRQLKAHFNLEGDLALELIRPWSPPARVAQDWQVAITEFPAVAGSSLLVRCRVAADGRASAEQALVLRAALWRDAWGTREPVVSGATFDAGRLEVRRVDLFRDRDALPAAVGDASFVFARAVPAGRLLTWRDVARRPLVRKGDVVEVSATAGTLAVSLKGIALQSGARGEVVTVRNPDSRKDFSAFVIDENRVQVRF
jgi:flagella basal body P-ring formation protein FlgA